ncbi:MAG: hypothetical protein U0V74_07190 [Chitinophagales bacterium]
MKENKWFITISWIGVCTLCTALYTLFFIHTFYHDRYISLSGDAEQYVGSAEKLYTNFEYSFYRTDDMNFRSNKMIGKPIDKGIYYAYRTPGYLFIYMPLRFLLNQTSTLYAILVLQVLAVSISKYLLARISQKIAGGTIFAFLTVMLCLNVMPQFHYLLMSFLTEPWAISFLVFSMACLFLVKEEKLSSPTILLISGFFMMIAVMLRPFLVFFPLFLLVWLFFKGVKKMSILVLFVLPILFVDTIWSARNLITAGEFIPLSKTLQIFDYSHEGFNAQRDLCKDLGTSTEWWKPESLIYWFHHPEDGRPASEVLPEKFLAVKENRRLMVDAKAAYTLSNDTSVNLEERIRFEKESARLIKIANNQFKTTYPLDASVKSRLTVLKTFIEMPLVKPLIGFRYPINVLTVFAEAFLYWFVVLGGFMAILFYVFVKRSAEGMILSFLPMFMLILFAFVIRLCEHRELFIPHFLLAALASAYVGSVFSMKKLEQKLVWIIPFIPILLLAGYTTKRSIVW